MTKWDPEITLREKRIMDDCIEQMENLNTTLTEYLATYSNAMQDNVQEGTNKMIVNIRKLVQEMQTEIGEKLKKLQDGGRLQNRIEEDAASKFNV